MKVKKEKQTAQKRNVDSLLKVLTTTKVSDKVGYFVLVFLSVASLIIVGRMGRSTMTIPIGGTELPLSSFAGVLSSISNICVIMLAVYYRKTGFITAVLILLSGVPGWLITLFSRHVYTIIVGMFNAALTLIAVTLFYQNNIRIERYQNRMRDQAITDVLTGLPNRFACSELMRKLVAQGEKFAVVLIDLNGFKSINDSLGNSAGNEALKEIARRWTAYAGSESATLDFVTRQGGDEFALIIRNYASAEVLAETIKVYEKKLSAKLTIDNCDLFLTGSFGYAEFPADADSVDSLLSSANAAMREVKRINSSNRILHFAPEMMRAEQTLEIERKLRTALETDAVCFHLQPQYNLAHQLRGFEALARMKDPAGALISPGEFIPVAEKVGLVDRVDATVFRKSAMFIGDLIRETGADITLSVNVSVRHLMKNDFLDEVRDILKTSGMPADHLEIEITESIMIDSAEKALRCISEIHKMGIKIAIDDFGTGYSSLSYLSDFPADRLKIDKSFIDKMDMNESSKQYVAAIISMGHIMGFSVVSEGVEEQNQIDTLRSIGCDYIQGFVWGRPLPPEDAGKLVKATA